VVVLLVTEVPAAPAGLVVVVDTPALVVRELLGKVLEAAKLL
tara:strand:- start:525 stop:650 length:126 start_codon:yes stop_codon:yes gene_type:complete